MQSSDRSRLLCKKGAIQEWRKLVLESDRMLQVLVDLDNFACKYTVIPDRCTIFEAFRMLRPRDVKVVMVAQSPYPGCCPATGVPYACGPAFMPASGCMTTPATLKNIVTELCRDMSRKTVVSPRDTLFDWIKQGVLLLNSSLTLGKGCPKYLENHSVLWEEVMRDILHTIQSETNPIFVLIGKDAWKFETSVSRVIKVSHPVASNYARDHDGWSGSSVFSSISRMMVENGDVPVKF